MKPSLLDLYTGLGGMTLAGDSAGMRTIGFAETAPFPAKLLRRRWPSIPNLGDVTRLCHETPPRILETIERPDVIAGGVPCQPSSLIGERRGTSDERWLWPDTIRIVRALRPRFGLFENPPAILNLESGRAFSGILGGLAAAGYDVLWECVSAGALGAGHRRDRVWILAADTDRPGLEGYSWDGALDGGPRQDGSVATPDLRDRIVNCPKWYAQSGIQPVAHGLSGRVVREQLMAVGNSLVPQVAMIFMRVIAAAVRAQWDEEARRCA